VVVTAYSDYDDAVRIANDSEYGLSGCVYSRDLRLAEQLARRMRTGRVFLNTASACIVEPFGGYKQSGLGREGGVEGIEDYLETKVIRAG
jgi:aldehyde dehydrogenase (NAD+)